MTNEELQKEMIAAMKAKDKVRLSIIRQVKAEVKNIEVNERRDVTEEDVNSMIKRLIKQTSETLEMSIKAGTDQERTDNLAEQVKILESLLPAQVSGEELEALIDQVIAELGATSKKQMGQVMGALGKATGGNFDKPAAAKIVGAKLEYFVSRFYQTAKRLDAANPYTRQSDAQFQGCDHKVCALSFHVTLLACTGFR